jgi:hypothetical protein
MSTQAGARPAQHHACLAHATPAPEPNDGLLYHRPLPSVSLLTAAAAAAGPWSHPASAAGAVAHAVTCGPLSAPFLVLLALPFCLRLAQCLSVWRRGGPGAQVANAAKYLSSLPAVVLTAMEHEAHKAK